MSKRFLDEDNSIAYRPQSDGNRHQHHRKKESRNKALEILFDPKSHRDYVTGFRKRKQQRRKDALEKLEKRERAQRLDERAERRQAIRDQLDLDRFNSDTSENEDSDNDDEDKEVKVFNAGNLTSTVTVAPIGSDSSDDDQLDSDEEDDDDEQQPTAKVDKPKKKNKPVYDNSHQAEKVPVGQVKKLTKSTLKIMAKTKLKIEGKKVSKHGGTRKNSKREENDKSTKRKGKRRH